MNDDLEIEAAVDQCEAEAEAIADRIVSTLEGIEAIDPVALSLGLAYVAVCAGGVMGDMGKFREMLIGAFDAAAEESAP